MPKKATTQSPNGRLGDALATLITNQARFVSQLARMDDRFARIESELGAIKNILVHHGQMLESLPEAIRQEIGFTP